MSNDNKSKFMKDGSDYIANINRLLQSIKSDVQVDFIHSENLGVTIVTNKVVSSLDLQTIEIYIKNTKHVIAEGAEVSCLPQSKLYLKIIDIPYIKENTNIPINANAVEEILKRNHIFNNITLESRLCIIKVSPKSDMAIIWFDIWDVQSSSNAKGLINRCFNVRSYIIIIRGTNISSGVS